LSDITVKKHNKFESDWVNISSVSYSQTCFRNDQVDKKSLTENSFYTDKKLKIKLPSFYVLVCMTKLVKVVEFMFNICK
jgi:C4-dicarboxylate transporter